jgi:hypothetical protein
MSVRLEQIGGEEAPNFHYFYVLLLVSIISDVCLNAFHLFLRAIWVSMGVCVCVCVCVHVHTHTHTHTHILKQSHYIPNCSVFWLVSDS